MSVITFIESLDGIERSRDPSDARRRLMALTEHVPILPLGQPEAVAAVQVRIALRQQGRSVRSRALDLLIAATALSHDLTLVTNNEADYREIPNLKIQPTNLTV